MAEGAASSGICLRTRHWLGAAADESNRARREIRGRVTYLILLRCPKPRWESPCYPGRGFEADPNRRDGRVVEGARLESVFRGNSNVGSNPTLSAIRNRLTL